jgi:hypothetical protein
MKGCVAGTYKASEGPNEQLETLDHMERTHTTKTKKTLKSKIYAMLHHAEERQILTEINTVPICPNCEQCDFSDFSWRRPIMEEVALLDSPPEARQY